MIKRRRRPRQTRQDAYNLVQAGLWFVGISIIVVAAIFAVMKYWGN